MTTNRTICTLALSMLLSGWANNSYAQTGEPNARPKPPDVGTYFPAEQSLRGSWRVSFTAISDYMLQPLRRFAYVRQPFRTLISFNQDSVLANALPSFTYVLRCDAADCTEDGMVRVTAGTGLGAWGEAVGKGYMFSYVHLLHDAFGNDMGEMKIYATVFLKVGAQVFAGQFVTEIFDENGQRVMGYQGKITGQRIVIEDLPLDSNGLSIN